MKKRVVKYLLLYMAALLAMVVALVIWVQLSYKYHYTVPETHIRASRDSLIIERGKYLVMGPAHCWNCHAADGETRLQTGTQTGMSGGLAFHTPFGTVYSPNITPDSTTGIGSFSDEALAGAIRYNVKHDKTALLPFMSFNGMSDQDISAVISYLRTIPPVKNKVPEEQLNIVGKAVRRFVIKPVMPEPLPATVLQPDTTIAYGKYLAVSVANCYGCHTNRNPKNGQFIGAPFAGGFSMAVKEGVFKTPNLTPDYETGALSGWTAADFTKRFRAGAAFPNTPMPWKPYQSFSDRDLLAIYKYLRSIPPAKNDVGLRYKPILSNNP